MPEPGLCHSFHSFFSALICTHALMYLGNFMPACPGAGGAKGFEVKCDSVASGHGNLQTFNPPERCIEPKLPQSSGLEG